MARAAALLLVLGCALAALWPARCTAAGARDGICLRARDGDSVLVRSDAGVLEVRLLGVDAPEHGQEYGEAAKAFTQALCAGRTVRLEYDARRRDHYGRSLCAVYVRDGDDWTLINAALARAGLALELTIPPNGMLSHIVADAVAEARRAGRGFWATGGLRETPRQFRRNTE